MATGEFNGDGDNADVVVGMPRGANLTGKVQILKSFDIKSLFHFRFKPEAKGCFYGGPHNKICLAGIALRAAGDFLSRMAKTNY